MIDGHISLDKAVSPLSELLSDALRRWRETASEIANVRGVVAHAIDKEAVGFYRRHGFLHSPQARHVTADRNRKDLLKD